MRVGVRAPSFAARTHHGETLELEALAGSPVVLMFFPFAFSRVCGSELAELHRRWDEVEATGARVLAISCDAVHSLRAYAEELSAVVSAGEHADDPAESGAWGDAGGSPWRDPPSPRPLALSLVSDFWPHGSVAKTYGVFDEERGAAQRASFILDGELIVRHCQQVPIQQARDLDETLGVLKGFQR